MSFVDSMMFKVSNLILQGAQISDKQFLEREIEKWKGSPQRVMQIKGHLYYDNDHDILHRKRQMKSTFPQQDQILILRQGRLGHERMTSCQKRRQKRFVWLEFDLAAPGRGSDAP